MQDRSKEILAKSDYDHLFYNPMIGKEEIVDKNTKHLYKGLSIKRP